MKNRITAIVAAALLITSIFFISGAFRKPAVAGDAVHPLPLQGTQPKDKAAPLAPDFTLMDLEGKQVTLSGYRGKKIVVIDFWATWCGPCRLTMPALHNYGKNHKKTVEVLSIDQQEDPVRVAEFIKAAGYGAIHVLIDKDGSVSQGYRVYGIPTMFVIDKDGLLRYKFVGYRPDLESHLDTVIKGL